MAGMVIALGGGENIVFNQLDVLYEIFSGIFFFLPYRSINKNPRKLQEPTIFFFLLYHTNFI